MKLLLDRVLILQHEAQKETQAGIVIPDAFANQPNRGTVVAVGTDEERLLHVRPGDVILFHPNAGLGIIYDEKEHLILRSADIIAVL